MHSQLDAKDADAILVALQAFEARCTELNALIAQPSNRTPEGRELAKQLYTSLRDDLRAAAKNPLVHEPKGHRNLTICESAFYEPAVAKAARAFGPSKSGRRSRAEKQSALSNAHTILSYWIRSLQGAGH